MAFLLSGQCFLSNYHSFWLEKTKYLRCENHRQDDIPDCRYCSYCAREPPSYFSIDSPSHTLRDLTCPETHGSYCCVLRLQLNELSAPVCKSSPPLFRQQMRMQQQDARGEVTLKHYEQGRTCRFALLLNFLKHNYFYSICFYLLHQSVKYQSIMRDTIHTL